jgi:plasmid maintenance system antidote protein VapI
MTRIVKLLLQQPFAQVVNELATILTPKILAERVKVSESTVSLWKSGQRGVKQLRSENRKNLIRVGAQVAKRKRGPRFDVEKLRQAIMEQLPPAKHHGARGPMKLRFEPTTQLGKDFNELYEASNLTQKEFAWQVGVHLNVINAALNDRIMKFKPNSAEEIIRYGQKIGFDVSKLEKYLPAHLRADAQAIKAGEVHHFSPIIVGLLKEGRKIERKMTEATLARILHTTRTSINRLMTGHNGPGKKLYGRLCEWAQTLPPSEAKTKLEQYQPTQHGGVHAK